MTNKSVAYIAYRFLTGRSRWVIRRSHVLTLIGIIVAVFALLAVSSVMNGFRQDMQKRIIGTRAEIRLTSKNGKPIKDYRNVLQKLDTDFGLKSAGLTRAELMLKRGTAMAATINFGIDLLRQQEVNQALKPINVFRMQSDNKSFKQGIYTGKVDLDKFNRNGIIIGSGLAQQLMVELGDTLQVITPQQSIPSAFGLLPNVRSLVICGIFISGMPEYDGSFSYISLPLAQEFTGKEDTVDQIEIKVHKLNQVPMYLRQLSVKFPDLNVESWSSFDPSLYSAMRFEKFLMLVIMGFMLIIASFNITGNMLKTIAQKKSELGLLKAIGYKPRDLSRLFIFQGGLLGVIGITMGTVSAVVLLMLQKKFGIIRLPFGGSSYLPLPVRMQWNDFVVIPLISILLTYLSIYLPVRRIRTISAVEILRQNN